MDIQKLSIISKIPRVNNPRFLLLGTPGSGKIFYAKHIAKSLDMPVLVKRASDLLSKYVGGSEQNIADAFEEATHNQAMLIIDEADSFLAKRQKAQSVIVNEASAEQTVILH